MNRDLAERLLSRILDWSTEDKAAERGFLEDFAAYKYDEYQQFAPGRRFLESLALWLRQFQTLEERRIAYEFVKTRLVFISDAEMNHLVELAFPTFVRPHLIGKVAAATGVEPHRVKAITTSIEYRTRLRETLILGLSDGARTDRFRRANPQVISNEQIWHAYDLSQEKVQDLKRKLEKDLVSLDTGNSEDATTGALFSTVVLLDDFTASGTTYIRQEKDLSWGGRIPKILQALEDDGRLSALIQPVDVDVIIIIYVAAQQAVRYIKEQIPNLSFNKGNIEFKVVHELNESTKLARPQDDPILELAAKPEYFDTTVDDDNAAVGRTSFQFGYAGCQLPVVLSHNTPNNSIYLLWSEDVSKIRGLFPRVSRHRTFE